MGERGPRIVGGRAGYAALALSIVALATGCDTYSARFFGEDGGQFEPLPTELDAGTALPSDSGVVAPDPEDPVVEPDPDPVDPVVPPGTFAIEFAFTTTLPAAEEAVFRRAAARWEAVIREDVRDVYVTTGSCGLPAATGALTVDDLLVVVEVRAIDGVGGALGASGPRCVRGEELADARYLPITAQLILDEDDVARLFSEERLEPVITHELGHALGFGTGWTELDLLDDPSCEGTTCEDGHDTHYTGVAGRSEWADLGGSGDVPVESGDAPGSADSHWRESIFGEELMTPRIAYDATSLPLGFITIGALEDLGYRVDYTSGEGFTLPGIAELGVVAPVPSESLADDVLRLPLELL